MEFPEYLDLAKRQLAVDLNCKPGDFDRAESVLTVSAANPGRRMYSNEKYFFQMATFGSNAVLSADEVLHPFLREFMADKTGHWLFEQEKLAVLESELNKYGYRLCRSHHMCLPKYDATFQSNIPGQELPPIRWFSGREQIEPFYDGRFYNALCERYLEERPDRIAVCAYDGDEIMGMAGCSEDAPGFLQIGIDVFPKYRGRGIGTYLSLLMKNEIIRRNKMPVYGTAAANIHSQNIAMNCGFRPAWVEIEAEKIPKEGNEMDEKEKKAPEPKPGDTTWVDDMKQELEDYIEEQGIYIRQ